MDLKEINCEATDRLELAQVRAVWQTVMNMVMNRRVP
jgi:hypothetical protein